MKYRDICICRRIIDGSTEYLEKGDWNFIAMRKDFNGKDYYIKAISEGTTEMKINYCPICGRSLNEGR